MNEEQVKDLMRFLQFVYGVVPIRRDYEVDRAIDAFVYYYNNSKDKK